MRFKFLIPVFLCCFNLFLSSTIAEVKEMNLKEGMIGAWLFDDGKGDIAKDSSGHNLLLNSIREHQSGALLEV